MWFAELQNKPPSEYLSSPVLLNQIWMSFWSELWKIFTPGMHQSASKIRWPVWDKFRDPVICPKLCTTVTDTQWIRNRIRLRKSINLVKRDLMNKWLYKHSAQLFLFAPSNAPHSSCLSDWGSLSFTPLYLYPLCKTSFLLGETPYFGVMEKLLRAERGKGSL